MPQEYHYPLTRVCLRQGALTLPRTMLNLFPETGDVTAVDTVSDEAFPLEIVGPRSVGGFAAFFAAHELEVNDELLIEPLEDGRFAVTPLSRHKTSESEQQRAVQALLDELAEADVPVTEAEIRALYPDVPEALDLRSALVADGRFAHHDGRWQLESSMRKRAQAEAAEAEAYAAPSQAASNVVEAVGVASSSAGVTADHAHASDPASEIGGTGGTTGVDGATEGESPMQMGGVGGAAEASAESAQQRALWSAGTTPAMAPAMTQAATPMPPVRHTPSAAPTGPASRGSPSTGAAGVGAVGSSSAGTGSPRPEEVTPRPPASRENSPASDRLEDRRVEDDPDLQMVGRAREALTAFGYRVESLGQGQLLAHAELGRLQYAVLVSALGYGQRLDWAALLSRRRATGARYLAVFGDYRDLHRLQGPADLARATLWSWDGLERARGLSRTVPVSPQDLEPHFDQGGLYDQGLERFEQTMSGRVAERGEFSEVLTRLAGMRAPRVFLLEELAGEGGLSRDHVLKVLERLSEAPFHIVARIDQGEFCLRQPIGPALDNLVSYARSLQSRLPNRTRAKVVGLSDPSEAFQEGAMVDGATSTSAEDAGAGTDPDIDLID